MLVLIVAFVVLCGCTDNTGHTDQSIAQYEILEDRNPINGSLQDRYTVYKDQNGETIKHGVFTKWHNNGQKAMEGQFQHGKLHGKLVTWHENGQKQFEEEYINGVRHGTFLSWEESGRPFSQQKFINGELIQEKEYRDGKWIDVPIPRNLCSVSASLTLNTRVRSTLYIVRSGSVEYICSHTMMRSPNMVGGDENAPWEAKVTVAMTEENVDGNIKYLLCSQGCSRSTTSHSAKTFKQFDRHYVKNLLADSINIQKAIPLEEESILYVEGDSQFDASPKMAVADFAKQNKGNFLVVTIKWLSVK
ncbi:MAG: hypothetical protein V1701_08135 [Planctomycetota bacterium]